jgi:hypothetical protein
MKNLEIIAKISKFFTVVSFVFTVLTTIVGYLLISLQYPGAPIEFKVYSSMQAMFPYLFVAVLSIVVAVVCWGITKETAEAPQETEALPQTAAVEEKA